VLFGIASALRIPLIKDTTKNNWLPQGGAGRRKGERENDLAGRLRFRGFIDFNYPRKNTGNAKEKFIALSRG